LLPAPRSARDPHRIAGTGAVVLTLACLLMLCACGGGGDSGSSATSTSLSESDATSDSSNATQSGTDSATSIDAVYDTTAALAVSVAAPSSSNDLAHALSVSAPITNTVIACTGGGSATLTVTGGTLITQLNGTLDAGEHYSVTYAQCSGALGRAQLNGSVEMDITSVSSASTPVTAATITATNLTVSLPLGSMTMNGSANVSRSATTSGAVTTTTSAISASGLTLATAFNGHTGSYALSNLSATRTVETTAGVTSGSQYSGHHTLSGTANGRGFSMTVATSGSVSYDASGVPISGTWTVVRPDATIATTVANGSVTLTVDDGSNGSIDHAWTFPTATLTAAAD
jgi:hypothetical protein